MENACKLLHGWWSQRVGFVLHAQVITGTAALHGCAASVDWSEQAYPPTVNAAPLVALVEEVAGKLGGSGAGEAAVKLAWQRIVEPSMAAEDFSFLACELLPVLALQETGVYFRFGMVGVLLQ